MRFPLHLTKTFDSSKVGIQIADADNRVVLVCPDHKDGQKIADYVVKWLNWIATVTFRKEVVYTREDWLYERDPARNRL